MNFAKLMIVVVTVVLVISAWKFFTRVDRTDATAVANAFTSALKSKDTSAASSFYVPDKAEAWQQATDERLQGMRSGAKERFFERIPAAPQFNTPVAADGKTTIVSGDKQFWLEMTQVDGKWYVVKTDFQ